LIIIVKGAAITSPFVQVVLRIGLLLLAYLEVLGLLQLLWLHLLLL